jgi:chromosome segregation ATPase
MKRWKREPTTYGYRQIPSIVKQWLVRSRQMTGRIPPATLLIACAALASAVAGCGGEKVDRRAYERDVRAALASLEDSSARPGDDPTQTRSALQKALAKVEKAKPPDDAREAHRELEAGLRQMVELLEQLEEEAGELERDPERAADLIASFSEGKSSPAARLARAEKLYADEGYDVAVERSSGR